MYKVAEMEISEIKRYIGIARAYQDLSNDYMAMAQDMVIRLRKDLGEYEEGNTESI